MNITTMLFVIGIVLVILGFIGLYLYLTREERSTIEGTIEAIRNKGYLPKGATEKTVEQCLVFLPYEEVEVKDGRVVRRS